MSREDATAAFTALAFFGAEMLGARAACRPPGSCWGAARSGCGDGARVKTLHRLAVMPVRLVLLS